MPRLGREPGRFAYDDDHDLITNETGRLEGKPCIRGLRISVETAVRLVAAGWSLAEIVDEYPDLELEDIEQALEYDEAFDAAAGVLAAVARHDRELLADLMPAALPWTRFLPAADRELMTEEIVATAVAAASRPARSSSSSTQSTTPRPGSAGT